MRRQLPLTILALILAGEASPKDRGEDFQITRINRDFITTPQINYTGAEQKRETRERWLRVEVEFMAAPHYTAEITFKYHILVSGNALAGQVTHVNVLGGRGHHSVMYLPPHALAFLLQGRPITTTAIENVGVEIIEKGEVKTEFSLKRGPPHWWESLPTTASLLLNQSETPFAALFWDYYEQIKATTH